MIWLAILNWIRGSKTTKREKFSSINVLCFGEVRVVGIVIFKPIYKQHSKNI